MKFFNLSLVLLLAVVAGCSKSSSNNTTTTPPPVVVKSDTTILSLSSNGVTDNANALQQAIDSCSIVGGGVLIIPASAGSYLTGPFNMKSNVNLHLDSGAVLVAKTGVAAFTKGGKLVDFISGGPTPLKNIAITGKGTIDGSGAFWWAAFNANNATQRPRLIYITGCNHLTLDGITLLNSPSFHFVPLQCQNVVVNNIKIIADPTSPNTDGIDPSQCDTVSITNCTIDNGDDDIAIKAAGLCQNITVKHCTFLHGHGLSIGSETNGNYHNLTVDSCTFNGTTNGIRIKSYAGAGGAITNTNYSNIIMQNVTNPIVVTLNYSNMGSGTSKVPSLDGFTINNLVVTGSANAGSITGLSNSILQNITLSNMNISANSKMVINYANNVTINNSTINGITVAPGSGNITATNVNNITGF